MIEKERIKFLNDKSINTNGKFVVYWMQASQRSEYNHALEYSIRRANELEKPLIVYFGIANDFPEANYRHYSFMIEGLKEVKSSLNLRNVKMIIELKNPDEGIIELSKDAVLLVTDRGYLKKEIEWRNNVSRKININFVQIETNVIVPIEEVSNKEEYSAATIRNKINKQLSKYIKDFVYESIENSIEIDDYFNFDNMEKYIKDNSVSKSKYFIGGTSQAKKHLSVFVESKINKYDELHNDPSLDYQSNMSPYLHFGQISPLYIYKEVNNEKYIEELVVRRELAINFIYFNKDYDNYNCIPNWAKKSLENHMDDKREYIYDLKTLEKGLTHDDYWNTAQKEMVITGKMHGYMRMYWGKKIIEWANNPEEAFRVMTYLNNKYNIDGRDANSYAGIAWCFGKHDRPWKERQIFGMIRYMNKEGLDRKFKMDEYKKIVDNLKL